MGLKAFLALADGTFIENPRHYRKAEKALKRAQRRVARHKKGSQRRRKAVKLLAKRYQKVRRQRLDFHHKTALSLVRQYDAIYYEAIQTKSLSARSPSLTATEGICPTGRAEKRVSTSRSMTRADLSF